MSVSNAQRAEMAKRTVTEIQKRIPSQVVLSRGTRKRMHGLRGNVLGFQFVIYTLPVIGLGDATLEVVIGEAVRGTRFTVTEHTQDSVVKEVLAFLADQYDEHVKHVEDMRDVLAQLKE